MVPNSLLIALSDSAKNGASRIVPHHLIIRSPTAVPRLLSSLKRLFRRCWNFSTAQLDKDQWTRGILQYRNTHTKYGPSPAQLLFGQPVVVGCRCVMEDVLVTSITVHILGVGCEYIVRSCHPFYTLLSITPCTLLPTS